MDAVRQGKEKSVSVVLYPSPGMGHLVSMMELGKLFASHGLTVTIVTVDPPYNTGATAAFIARASEENPSIAFHRLPSVAVPPNASRNHEALAFDLLRLSNPNLRTFLRSLSSRALVVDFFCTYAFDVAAELNIPCYIFYTSGANVLACFLHIPVLHAATTKSFQELGSQLLHPPGIPPLPADHMPLHMQERDDDAYRGFMQHCSRFPDAQGIIVNTFEALEPRALKAIASGRCVPDGQLTPSVYCIGPLIMSNDRGNDNKEECLAWLDAQPRASVVFLCFGSLGVFSAEQIKEIAVGLERSEQRFLWVVRSPPIRDPAKRFERPADPDLETLLPDGFLERTKERGLVVKSWAPQAEVLSHESTGGFMSHVGWNSALEAITAGVPMVAWPLYAEQRMNKVFLAEEMRLAVAVKGYDQELVFAAEVEEKVRWLMASEGGQKLRERTADVKESAAEALRDGGTSHAALMKLVTKWKKS